MVWEGGGDKKGGANKLMGGFVLLQHRERGGVGGHAQTRRTTCAGGGGVQRAKWMVGDRALRRCQNVVLHISNRPFNGSPASSNDPTTLIILSYVSTWCFFIGDRPNTRGLRRSSIRLLSSVASKCISRNGILHIGAFFVSSDYPNRRYACLRSSSHVIDGKHRLSFSRMPTFLVSLHLTGISIESWTPFLPPVYYNNFADTHHTFREAILNHTSLGNSFPCTLSYICIYLSLQTVCKSLPIHHEQQITSEAAVAELQFTLFAFTTSSPLIIELVTPPNVTPSPPSRSSLINFILPSP